MRKLSSTLTIDGVTYGPIVDTQQAGETWDDFTLRHAVHVLRWKAVNFPEAEFEDWTVTKIEQ